MSIQLNKNDYKDVVCPIAQGLIETIRKIKEALDIKPPYISGNDQEKALRFLEEHCKLEQGSISNVIQPSYEYTGLYVDYLVYGSSHQTNDPPMKMILRYDEFPCFALLVDED